MDTEHHLCIDPARRTFWDVTACGYNSRHRNGRWLVPQGHHLIEQPLQVVHLALGSNLEQHVRSRRNVVGHIVRRRRRRRRRRVEIVRDVTGDDYIVEVYFIAPRPHLAHASVSGDVLEGIKDTPKTFFEHQLLQKITQRLGAHAVKNLRHANAAHLLACCVGAVHESRTICFGGNRGEVDVLAFCD